MQRNPIPQVVLAAALSACSLQPELLNSERIEQRFGSYGIEVLSQNAQVRRSNLYSGSGATQTCRTYAVVSFADPATAQLGQAHQAVMAGESIGSTFQAAGWQIHKINSYIGSLQLPDANHEIGKLMHLESEATLGIHAYELMLHKGKDAVHYATIIEAHHPDYLDAAELRDLYPLDRGSELRADDVQALFQLVLESPANSH
jgi:hypothetical protein